MLKFTELRVLVLCVLIPIFAGCVTTQERPDGSTHVRVSFSEALGMKRPNPAVVQSPARNPEPTIPAAQVALDPQALKDLKLALECKPMRNLDASLKKLKLPGDNRWFDAPAGLKAFGLPVAKVSFYVDAGQGDSLSRAIFDPSISFVQLTKAASLKHDPQLGRKGEKYYIRSTKVGQLAASPSANGVVEIECSPFE